MVSHQIFFEIMRVVSFITKQCNDFKTMVTDKGFQLFQAEFVRIPASSEIDKTLRSLRKVVCSPATAKSFRTIVALSDGGHHGELAAAVRSA